MRGEKGLEPLLSLMESHSAPGGHHLQINVVDAASFDDAIERPQLYPDPTVRVAGFRAYFTRLSSDVHWDIERRYLRDGDR